VQKQRKPLSKLKTVIDFLANEEILPLSHRDHSLSGIYIQYRECHITPDWLLIYRVEGDILKLVRMGSHAELFKM
tara:strand:+ start:1203 stop:1427 length:225 start_codon:yes stop_codon:yes gene_type:complete